MGNKDIGEIKRRSPSAGDAFFAKMINELTAEYNAEAARIELTRLATWSSLAMQTEIAGIAARPLTLQAWIDLKAAGNALVSGEEPTAGDLIAYIWRNHPLYATAASRGAKRIQKAITKAVITQDPMDVIASIFEHIDEAFGESPENANAKAGNARYSGFPAVMGGVYAIDEIANRYGMHPHEVLAMPLTQIYQLQKVIRHCTVPNYKPAQPDTLRRLSGKILEAMNNGES